MEFAILDFETTGLVAKESEVTEVAVLVVDEDFEEVSSFHTFVNIEGDIPKRITSLTGITKEDCDKGMDKESVGKILEALLKEKVLVCQHAPFDISFLDEHFDINVVDFVCTRTLTAFAQPFESASLKPTCDRLGIEFEGAHRAMNDVRATAKVLKHWKNKGVYVQNTVTDSKERPLNYVPDATLRIMDLDKRRNVMLGVTEL